MCPALQKKPQQIVTTPEQVDPKDAPASTSDGGVALHASGGKAFDPFAPPYNENLYVGGLKDEGSEEEYVVLVGFNFPFFVFVRI